jgi:hypothetical protein
MWPKVLIELVPHIVRLVPMADRFLQSKTAGDEANRKAMEVMAEGLRGDLGQVTAAHSGLYRQLNEQSEKLAGIAAEVEVVKLATESVEGRLARLQRRVTLGNRLLVGVILLNLLLVALVLFIVVRH